MLEPHHSPLRSAFAAAETSCALGPSGFEKFPGPARPLPPSTCSSTKAEAETVRYEAESGYWDLWNPSNESYDNDLDKKYTITVHHYN